MKEAPVRLDGRMGPQPLEDENFCLRWNDYEKKYAETFRTLREDEVVNCTIVHSLSMTKLLCI